MAITAPIPIPAAGLPLPNPADRATFSPRKLEQLRWANEDLAPGALALAQNAYNNAGEAHMDAASAATSATAAMMAATTAATSAGALPWASGVYAQYAVVLSPASKRIYRKTSAGAGVMNTDPSLDPTNWTRANDGLFYEAVTAASKTVQSGGAYAATGGAKTRFVLPAFVEGSAAITIKPANELETNEIDAGAASIEGNTGILILDNPFRAYTLQPINGKWRFTA